MSKNEEKIAKVLLKAKIPFEREKTFSDLRNGKYRFDFCINFNNEQILIEVDGPQHLKQTSFFHKSRQDFLQQQERDRRKNSYCIANGLKLYRIQQWDIDKIQTIDDILKKENLVKSKWHNDLLKGG